jgi:hypothetical protein
MYKVQTLTDLPKCQGFECKRVATKIIETNEMGFDCSYLYCDECEEFGRDLSYAEIVRQAYD